MSRTQIYFSNAYIRASGFDAGGLANEGGTWNPCSDRFESVVSVLVKTLFGRLAELAEYIDGDAIDEPVDRCPSKVQ